MRKLIIVILFYIFQISECVNINDECDNNIDKSLECIRKQSDAPTLIFMGLLLIALCIGMFPE